MKEYLLDVQDLKTYFKTRAGYVHAVDGVSFAVKAGEKGSAGGRERLWQKCNRPLNYAPGSSAAR
ncbi:hypothetical protein KDK_13310 [Dictyobacter kobayashii]|uniref:Uncharacterized protein n=1 Tax=Dictyobacter kobayashii TaxID=2014872 RepID=A0A402AEL0_9CHLR|nr:hypothetical protein [Dictyobacter kobayashii]GCE17531.1 hypothetical protein KDK_13310 [Dictyobacter kobayashii]